MRVQDVEDPLVRRGRYLTELVDEPARGGRWTRSYAPWRVRRPSRHAGSVAAERLLPFVVVLTAACTGGGADEASAVSRVAFVPETGTTPMALLAGVLGGDAGTGCL